MIVSVIQNAVKICSVLIVCRIFGVRIMQIIKSLKNHPIMLA